MKVYIYTADDCPKCVKLKKEFTEKGIAFEERSADRIKNQQDYIDKEALIEASMNNMELPVVVTMDCIEEIWKERQGS